MAPRPTIVSYNPLFSIPHLTLLSFPSSSRVAAILIPKLPINPIPDPLPFLPRLFLHTGSLWLFPGAPKLLPRTLWSTHSIAIPQCLPALSPAAWKPERPMRATVGVMVRGPMYLNRAPGRPSKPITTSIREDMIIAPWIWTHKNGKEFKANRKRFVFLLWITNCT